MYCDADQTCPIKILEMVQMKSLKALIITVTLYFITFLYVVQVYMDVCVCAYIRRVRVRG